MEGKQLCASLSTRRFMHILSAQTAAARPLHLFSLLSTFSDRQHRTSLFLLFDGLFQEG
jgi:hypothetical protein